jgi:hypothetical protein
VISDSNIGLPTSAAATIWSTSKQREHDFAFLIFGLMCLHDCMTVYITLHCYLIDWWFIDWLIDVETSGSNCQLQADYSGGNNDARQNNEKNSDTIQSSNASFLPSSFFFFFFFKKFLVSPFSWCFLSFV